MVESRTDIARAMIDATIILQRRSLTDIALIHSDLDQSRRAIAASRDLLKRFRQRKLDEAIRQDLRISAFDADILRKAFRELILETNAPETQWRDLARSLVYEFTGCERVQSGLVDWIVRK
ncbi:hypothetical protein [Mesorhizobium sp. ES1-4]|uniref:hypothetical protein n=1 Tax=Mesorhizobium sp. ES1-4 TaxID=2876627 RepID=UPI001CCAA6CB|nr:hypothetical protein [Mesorhizobium sp. ES1-4]MBZ9798338.1 hypothetical protein [Mesorhizobium sp. ES1-4]